MNTILYNTEPQTLETPVTRWPASGPGERARQTISRAVDTLLVWAERARQRRHLRHLDERLLADIGLNEGDVARELRKPFWKP